MSQHFVKLRQKYRRQIRKKQLEQQFEQSRKNWKVQQLKNEQRQFYKMSGEINQDNYSQYIPSILNFCYNDSLNFMLLPLVPYIYEDIISKSHLQQNFLILQALTQFQEIQLPQTEQLVNVFIESLSSRCKVTLNIISNLLQNHRYEQILRDLLLQANFMYDCQSIINNYPQQYNGTTKSDLNYLYFSIGCKFIKSHPIVDYQIMQQIGKSLVELIRGDQEKYQLFQTLSQISQTFKPSLQIAQLLYNLLIKTITTSYIQFQQQMTQFFIYCIRSNLFIEPSLQKIIVDTLQSHNKRARSKALTILQLEIKRYEQFERKFIYEQLKQLRFVQILSNLYVTSDRNVKIQCLQCFNLLTRSIILDQDGSRYAQILVLVVSQALNDCDNDLIQKALNILLNTLLNIHNEQIKTTPIFALLQKYCISSKVSNLNFESNKQLNNIQQQILNLIPIL